MKGKIVRMKTPEQMLPDKVIEELFAAIRRREEERYKQDRFAIPGGRVLPRDWTDPVQVEAAAKVAEEMRKPEAQAKLRESVGKTLEEIFLYGTPRTTPGDADLSRGSDPCVSGASPTDGR